MNKWNSLFRPIDEAIFKAVDDIKGNAQIGKISDEIAALPENQQKIVNQILSLLMILIPFLIVVLLYSQNSSQKKNIAVKNEIIRLVTETNQKSNELALTSRHIIGTGSINDISDLQRLVRSSLTSREASPDAITITNFDQTNAGDSLTRTVATLNFTGLTTQNFTAVLQDLLTQQKMKISALQIDKKIETKLIQGSLEIYHFSKIGE